jgi:protoporphyrinogen oxidase
MTHVRTLILGGGMSGLSCAYHLKNDYLLIEKSDEPGGLSRSIKQDGFVFDHTGHLLHLRNPYTLKLIPELLGDNLALNQRRAWIYSHGAYTRYPYQANLYGLPKKVIEDCLKGLIEAQLRPSPNPLPKGRGPTSSAFSLQGEGGRRPDEGSDPESLKSWVLRTFGRGFAKHFFFPYNEKLWKVPQDVLTAEWVAPFVPKPSVQEVINGAFSDQTKKFGYNASFYYPKEGGIQALAFAFAKGLKDIRLNTEASSIDLERKEVTLKDGETLSYDYLVSTLPLARFLKMTCTLPPEIQTLLGTLRWSSVYDINLGIKRPNLSDKHWIYFPEKKYRFYRVGFPMNFAQHMTPTGCSSMYVEIAYVPGEPLDEARAMKDAIRGLKECGLLRNEEEIVTRNLLHIPVAYVTYDKNRTRSTEAILKFLASHHVSSIGRFGGWKYSYMEEAILEGKATAEQILRR